MPENDLTPEELRELEELETLDAQLSPEEAQELEQLEALDAQVPAEPISQTESGLRGAAQGVSFGFADEVSGAIEAAADIATGDKTISEFSSLYTKYRDESRDAFKDAEQQNPKSYLSGEVAGAVGSVLVPAGIAGKIGGATLKGILSGTTLKAAVGLGAVEGLGRAEKITDVGDIAGSAALGAAGFGVGKVAAKGFKALRSLKSTKAVEGAARKKANALLDAVGIKTGKKVNDFEKFTLKRRNVSEEQFMDDVLKDIDLSDELSAEQIRDKIVLKRDNIWKKEVQPIFDAVDEAAPEGVINTQRLMANIQDEVEAELVGMDPTAAAKHVDKITKSMAGFADKPTISLSDAQSIKNQITKRYNFSSLTDANQTRGAILRVIKEEQEDAVERSISAELKDKFLDSKRRFGNLAEITEFANKSSAEARADIIKFGDDAVSMKDHFQAAASFTPLYKNPAAVARVGSSLMKKAARKSPVANRQMASLLRIAEKVDAAPGKYSDRIIGLMAAAGRNMDDFVDGLGELEATINLDQAPVERTSESVVQRATDILPLLKKEQPGVHSALQTALKEGDTNTSNSIMSDLGRLKPSWMAPGIGIDGKAVTETDRIETLSLINSTTWGTTQKMLAIDNLKVGSLIPNFQDPATSPIAPKRAAKARTRNGKKKVDY